VEILPLSVIERSPREARFCWEKKNLMSPVAGPVTTIKTDA
jgi:hypothetical protein